MRGREEDEKDKIALVAKKTQEVSDMAQRNIELAIQRGEKIEDLENKSDDLARGANEFNRGAKGIKQMYCRRNLRNNIIIFVIVVTILGLIIWAISK